MGGGNAQPRFGGNAWSPGRNSQANPQAFCSARLAEVRRHQHTHGGLQRSRPSKALGYASGIGALLERCLLEHQQRKRERAVQHAPAPDSTTCTPGSGASGPPSRSQPISGPRASAEMTRIDGTRAASAAFCTGTTARPKPAPAAAAIDGRTPGTGRILPSRPSSPRNTVPASPSLGTTPAADKIAIAMARSIGELRHP